MPRTYNLAVVNYKATGPALLQKKAMNNRRTCYTTTSGFARCQVFTAVLLKMQVF
jgi:hypothetical protein